MKKLALAIIGLTLISSAAFADTTNDRRVLAPGVIGITHTENFEYVCDVTQKDSSGETNIKMWLDVDFDAPIKYRLAAGFVGGGSVDGLIGAEANVVEAAQGRCLGLCLSITLSSEDGNSTAVFSEDLLKNTITVSTSENGVTSPIGTCKKNEVE